MSMSVIFTANLVGGVSLFTHLYTLEKLPLIKEIKLLFQGVNLQE